MDDPSRLCDLVANAMHDDVQINENSLLYHPFIKRSGAQLQATCGVWLSCHMTAHDVLLAAH